MKNFVRGAGIHVAVVFRDKNGAVVNPDGANVTLSYVPRGVGICDRVFSTFALALTQEDPLDPAEMAWSYDWDSSVAGAGVIFGTALTTDLNVPVSQVDFQFRLVANRANKELAGDDLLGTGY